jgi:hypothetical protein
MKLSEQLIELSARAKQAEDMVAAAQAKNRAAVDKQRAQLQTAIDDGAAAARANLASAQDKVESWWDETRAAVDARFAALRTKVEQSRGEREAKRALNRADEAEEDAADAVAFAIWVLDQAEYAVADAVLARGEADDLAQKQPL